MCRTITLRPAASALLLAAACVAGCSTSFELDPRRLGNNGGGNAGTNVGPVGTTTEDGRVVQRNPNAGQLNQAGQMPSSDSALLATYAVRGDNAYPDQLAPQAGLRVHAVVARNGDWVKLYNFTGEPLRDAKIWVNGAYLAPLAALPIDQSATLRRGQFFNRHGVSLAQDRSPVTSVQVQTDEKSLYRLEGPVLEPM